VVQRHLLYLGEINDSQQAAWQKSIAVFSEGAAEPQQVALFPEDRVGAATEVPQLQLKLSALRVHRPRQWGACWLALELWRELGLERFWREKLPPSREGTRWDLVLTTLAIYRWLDPGSEWRLHREWFERSALGDLLASDCALVADDTLYRCHDLLLAHKAALFSHLQERWRDLFNAKFDVLLYDLTSTYFECDPPEEARLRHFGYSRDRRSDCVQVVIALIVTPEGFPLGYEVLAGNTADKTTLKGMLAKIEKQYGKAERTWLMDRGIPTEALLAEMRASTPPVRYLVGTPKGRLPVGKRARRPAMAGGARGRGGEAFAARRRTLRLRAKRGPHRQGTRHAPQTPGQTLGAAAHLAGANAHLQRAAHETGRGQGRGGPLLGRGGAHAARAADPGPPRRARHLQLPH
jgi:hypothetical protein